MEDADLCIRLHMAGPAGQPRRRGRVVQIHSVANRTSGRRLASWGSVHATGTWGADGWWRHVCSLAHPSALRPAATTPPTRPAAAVHVVIGLSWYCGASPDQLVWLYHRLYTDVYR